MKRTYIKPVVMSKNIGGEELLVASDPSLYNGELGSRNHSKIWDGLDDVEAGDSWDEF